MDGEEYLIYMSGVLPAITHIGKRAKVHYVNFGKSVRFRSNMISLNIDGPQARESHKRFYKEHHKRMKIKPCDREMSKEVAQARKDCHLMATEAAKAAATGPADRMEEHFLSADNATRLIVSSVFDVIAMECGDQTGSTTRDTCSFEKDDKDDYCSGEKTAIYLDPDDGHITYCDPFFDLPPTPVKCYDRLKAPSSLVEKKLDFHNALLYIVTFGHAGGTWKEWMDLGHHSRVSVLMNALTQMTDNAGAESLAYTYNTRKDLGYLENIYNAETYSLFAFAVSRNCSVKS